MGLTRPSQLELDCHVPEERGARSTAKCSTLTGGPKAKPVNSLLCSYETIRLVLRQLITPVNVLLCQSLTFELEANTCGLRNSLCCNKAKRNSKYSAPARTMQKSKYADQ